MTILQLQMYKTAIACLFEELQYESYEGITTRHMCECLRKSCRRNKCVLCIIDEMQELITELQDKHKEKSDD